MSYLLDRSIRRKKVLYIILAFFICLILFYFRVSILNGLSMVSHTIFRPVWVVGNSISEKLGSVSSFFTSKNSLYLENQNLKLQLDTQKALMSNYDYLLNENISLKEILGRKNQKTPMILAAILSKPNQSVYDTVIIDAGMGEGIQVGDKVFALGNIPVGRVAEVYSHSSKVILLSNSGEKTKVLISRENILLELVGRGGGNFEMILPRNFTPTKGDQVVLPGINPYVVAVVETIISDPRDPFVKALLVSPVNIQELKFVEVGVQTK